VTVSAQESPPDDSSSRASTFESLRIAAYRTLWLGGLFTFLSVQMQFIARGWLAFELTGTNAGLGLVYLGFGVSMLVCTPFGGVAADRLEKRKVLIASQVVLALTSLAIGVAVQTDMIEYWMLVASAVLQGIAFSFVGPGRMAFTAEIVGRGLLPNAVVLQQLSMNGTRVFGPAVAGVLIGVAFIGIAGVYLVTTVIAALSLAFTIALPPSQPKANKATRSPLGDIADGVRYVFSNPLLRLLMLAQWIVVMAAFPYVAFLPTVAERLFNAGSGGYGLLNTATAIGAVAVSLVIAKRVTGEVTWTMLAVFGLLFGASVAALGAAPLYWVGWLVAVLIGVGSSGFQSLVNSLLLTNSSTEMHGRVQSLAMLAFSGFGMAAAPLGALADAVGLRQTLWLMGAVAFITTLWCWIRLPRVRSLAAS